MLTKLCIFHYAYTIKSVFQNICLHMIYLKSTDLNSKMLQILTLLFTEYLPNYTCYYTYLSYVQLGTMLPLGLHYHHVPNYGYIQSLYSPLILHDMVFA